MAPRNPCASPRPRVEAEGNELAADGEVGEGPGLDDVVVALADDGHRELGPSAAAGDRVALAQLVGHRGAPAVRVELEGRFVGEPRLTAENVSETLGLNR